MVPYTPLLLGHSTPTDALAAHEDARYRSGPSDAGQDILHLATCDTFLRAFLAILGCCYWGVTLCRPTPREVAMLVHATPREVNPGRAKSTHGHIV